MKKKKRLKLKKKVYYFGAFVVFLTVAILLGINYYNDYQYKQTNEYKLLEKGYSLEDTKTIFAKLSETEQQKLINNDKDDKIISLLEQKYFLEKNLEDYQEYIRKNNEDDYAKVISIVNVHANHKWYQLDLNTQEDLGMLMNVNKFYTLSETYVPENLRNIELSYAYGEEGENDYRVSTQGERKADETAARPGHSEHQTGLVIDMTSKTEPLADSFSNSEAYKWLKENAYKYGFIERYPEGKTYLTGYSPESWHWRYVGEEAAKLIHDEDITFDEYYAFYIEK